ncbi:MAG: hypothetical protein EKK41_10625 [Hyphomicrobiales bacterium]|nr:MAG: hypothetical protein EKK41_10625 [Hyphomicrobiales bacterium]
MRYNPLPDLISFELSLPSGRTLKAQGKVGLLRVMIDLDTETLEIDHAARSAEQAAGLAQRFSVSEFPSNARFKVNGELSTGNCSIPDCLSVPSEAPPTAHINP